MQGFRRKLLYVSLYEGLAIISTSLILRFLITDNLKQSTLLALVTSAVAISWNFIYNYAFESLETICGIKGRPLWWRGLHALGFEGGLVLVFVPLFAWSFQVSLWQALSLQIGLVIFFLLYSFVFTWVFDQVWGLPASAGPAGH